MKENELEFGVSLNELLELRKQLPNDQDFGEAVSILLSEINESIKQTDDDNKEYLQS
jgi:hypothetical protein